MSITSAFKSGFLRKVIIVCHDLFVILLALMIALKEAHFHPRHVVLYYVFFLIGSFLCFYALGLYKSRWRFASLPDLASLFVAVLCITMLWFVSTIFSIIFLKTPEISAFSFLLFFIFCLFFLSFSRLSYRYWRFWRDGRSIRRKELPSALIVGHLKDIETTLSILHSDKNAYQVAGFLSLNDADVGVAIQGISVFGTLYNFDQIFHNLKQRGIDIKYLILLPSAMVSYGNEQLVSRARAAGVFVQRFEMKTQRKHSARLTPIRPEELLLRPTLQLDEALMKSFIRKKRIIVTGGGGSIGSVLCEHCLTYGAERVLVIENSEVAMHRVLEKFAEQSFGQKNNFEGRIVDIRDEKRLNDVFADFKPDLVFHAAALKHVPYLEVDWQEAIKTNVFGTYYSHKAAIASGAKTFILISTDKAVLPVSMLGYTKRAAEILVCAQNNLNSNFTSLAVRFGNVLGSAGSVMETFSHQIELGGPVTVTHKDMVRYFMTISEAVDLVIASSAFASSVENLKKHAIFVLKMGQPVRILELAERMISLAGFEPYTEIPIAFTKPRAGEKLYETLFGENENDQEIGISGVVAAPVKRLKEQDIERFIQQIEKSMLQKNKEKAIEALKKYNT